ncbi:IS701 family transposase [Streptacidiphilus sp. N1-10]|uniref:IS701 family transposase n=1 Tax=Streptacidiphilus jeojiensis TaxID=3229225 RepID=A0ABV6XLI2_9ACTN
MDTARGGGAVAASGADALAAYAADVLGSVRRRDQRARAVGWLERAVLDGGAGGGVPRNLRYFVNRSPWDPAPVLRRIAERVLPVLGPQAWVVEDVSFPKRGRLSVGVARQFSAGLGRRARCQVAVGVHAVVPEASCPLQWRLFLNQEWADDAERRQQARVPVGIGHREKWRLALDALDQLAGWGMVPPVLVADSAYGTGTAFRAGLAARGVPHLVGVHGELTVHPESLRPAGSTGAGRGARGLPRYREAPWSVRAMAQSAGREAYARVDGAGPATRFLALRVRPAGARTRRLVRDAAVAREGRWDGVLPVAGLLAEWPDAAPAPSGFWLTDLPERTPLPELVRLAGSRGRVAEDRAVMRDRLGFGHYEGRSWPGWHHHVTLSTAAHAFTVEQRLG